LEKAFNGVCREVVSWWWFYNWNGR